MAGEALKSVFSVGSEPNRKNRRSDSIGHHKARKKRRTAKEIFKGGKRDKSLNTVEFNRKWRKRRAKAKHDAINRHKNQVIARRKRK